MPSRFRLHRSVQFAILLLLGNIISACDLPYDQSHTLARVRHGRLKVGVVANPPWTRVPAPDYAGATVPEASGVEANLLKGFAASLDSTPQWFVGPEAVIMESLKERQLDMAIGGLTKDSEWKKHLGFSAPYAEDEIIVAAPPGVSSVTSVKEHDVAARDGTHVAALVRKKGARLVAVTDVKGLKLLVALTRSEAATLGYAPTNVSLAKDKHVMAVAPGENGFLRALDLYLAAHKAEVGEMLRKESVHAH